MSDGRAYAKATRREEAALYLYIYITTKTPYVCVCGFVPRHLAPPPPMGKLVGLGGMADFL